jgi:hypothetical protein
MVLELGMGHIFISYSHKDTEYAHLLAEDLQSKGFGVWIDARLDYGSQWPLEIQKQLDACEAFIILMSPRSFASEWVQSEVQRAKRKLKPIFPLLLEGDEPWLSMESTQYYDVRSGGLPDARFYSALKRVVSTDQASSTLQFPKVTAPAKPVPERPKSNPGKGIAIGVIGALAALFLLCVVALVGIRILFFTQSPSSPDQTYDNSGTIDSSAIATVAPTAVLDSVPAVTEAPFVPKPQPVVVLKDYIISQCCNSVGQRSDSLDYTLNINTVDTLQVEFKSTDPNACSDVFLHILVDGDELYTTGAIGPVSGNDTSGLIDLSSSISGGEHTLTISPEGIPGGCNQSGILGGWGGTLTVGVSLYP